MKRKIKKKVLGIDSMEGDRLCWRNVISNSVTLFFWKVNDI